MKNENEKQVYENKSFFNALIKVQSAFLGTPYSCVIRYTKNEAEEEEKEEEKMTI